MIVVVTGGCGFVGLNVLRALIGAGVAEIRIVDNLTNSRVDSLRETLASVGPVRGEGPWQVDTDSGSCRIELTVADIRDVDTALRVCAGGDAVVHLAAQTGVQLSLQKPADDLSQNVTGSFVYLDAARRREVGRFVAASSLAVVGGGAPPQREESPYAPLSPYAAGKAALEAYCLAYFHSFGVKAVPLRFANLYGPFSWHKGSVVAEFCKRAIRGEPLVVDGDGGQTRDFVCAEDLAEVVAAVVLGRPYCPDDAIFGKPLNLATGRQTCISDLATAVQACFRRVDIHCRVEFGPRRPADVVVSAPDASRLRNLFPGIPFRPLEKGLPLTVRWFLDNWAPNEGVDRSSSL